MAGRALFQGPTREPVSLAEARAHCRLDTDAEDALLAGRIITAREHLERFTNRALVPKTWDLTFDYAFPRVELVLPFPDVQSVVSIAYVDTAGAPQTLAADQYQLVRRYEARSLIVPAFGASWPTVRHQPDAITVRAVIGYPAGALPYALRQALLLLVGHWTENLEATTDAGLAEIPLGVQALASPYRVDDWL